jgi:hypothetical protein
MYLLVSIIPKGVMKSNAVMVAVVKSTVNAPVTGAPAGLVDATVPEKS